MGDQTIGVGFVHVLTHPGGPCADDCPHPDHDEDCPMNEPSTDCEDICMTKCQGACGVL